MPASGSLARRGFVTPTQDTTGAISRAIASASAQKLDVWVPPGTYTATTGIALQSGVNVVMSPGSVIDCTNLSGLTLFSGTSLTDVRLHGGRVTNLASTKVAVAFTSCNRVRVDSMTIGSGGGGIKFSYCNDVWATNNHVTVTADSGSGFFGYGVLHFAGNGGASVSGFHFIGNTIIGTTPAYCHGIYWYGNDAAVTTTVTITDGTVLGNIVENVTGGIWGANSQYVSVTGNQIKECLDVGVDFEACQDCAGVGNVVHNSKNGGLAALYSSKRIMFTANRVSSDRTTMLGGGSLGATTSNFVYVRDKCEDVLIAGNQFSCTGASSMGEVAVWKNAQSTASDRVVVRDNQFHNGCIQFFGQSVGATVEGNAFYFDFDYQAAIVKISQTKNVVVRNNRFWGASNRTASSQGGSDILINQADVATTPRVENVLVENNWSVNTPSSGITVNTNNGTNHTTFVVRNNVTDVVYKRTSSPASAVVSGNIRVSDNASVSATNY